MGVPMPDKITTRQSLVRYTAEESRAFWEKLHPPKSPMETRNAGVPAGKTCGGCNGQRTASRPTIRPRAAPREEQATIQWTLPPSSGGAGTELKTILARFGIVSQPNCRCGQRAREMDSNGIEWCEDHLEEIVDWLEEEATRRRLPFVRLAGKVLVRRAISNAKRKEKAK